MRRTDGGQGRGCDAHAGRHWDAVPQRDDGGYPTDGAGAAAGSQRDAHTGRHWDAQPQNDGGGYPAGGAGAATGSQRDVRDGRHWGSESRWDGGEYPATLSVRPPGVRAPRAGTPVSDNDGPAAALLELRIVGPVATPVPGQPDVAYDS